MEYVKKAVAAGILTAATLGVASQAHAQAYVETTDAGQTLPTALTTGINASIGGSITGSFSSATDADLYVVSLSLPGTLTASTANPITDGGGQDTELFLFDSTGHAIVADDDTTGGLTTDSTFSVALAAGTYYVGISESGNEPINSASQLLFTGYPGGDTTATRGAASGVNPTTESNFNGNTYVGGSGAYEITLASVAAVPEPSSWAAIALGSMASAFTFLRRRRTR